MECITCPVKSLCDAGIKPQSCDKIRTPLGNKKQSEDDVMKMFNELFGKAINNQGGKK